MTVALLGTGIMGAGMARNIAKAGLPLKVWNRSREKAEPLADVATVTDTAAEALDGADVVVTMLFDEGAVEGVMKDAKLAPDAVWAQMSTVGVEGTARLSQLSDRFVDAPVLGTRKPAEDGTLLVLASGPESLRSTVEPVFDAVGQRTMWVSEQPGDASKLKLVLNAYILALTSGIGQSIALARSLGLDPQLFLDGIAGGATDTPYSQIKGGMTIRNDFSPSFTLDGALKDAGLIGEALRSGGLDDSLITAVQNLLRRAADAGHGEKDMSAVYHGFH